MAASTSLPSGFSLPTLPSASDSPPWIPSDRAMLSNQDPLPDNSSSPDPVSHRRRVRNPDHADDPDCSGDDDHARRRLLRNGVDQDDMMEKIDTKSLGDRPQEVDDTLHKSRKNKERDPDAQPPSPVRQSKQRRLQEEESALTPVATKDGGIYRPTNKESRAAYVSILGVVQQLLGSQPDDVLYCGADEVLALLKNSAFKKAPKKMMKKMEKLLFSRISSTVFDELVRLGNCITDFQHPGGASTDDETLEDDDDVEEEEEDDDEERNASTVGSGDDDVEEDEMQQGNEGTSLNVEEDIDPYWLRWRRILKKLRENSSGSPEPESHLDDELNDEMQQGNEGMSLDVEDIDAYWLQRKILKAYEKQMDDPQQCQKLAEEVLQILAQGDDREVEARLLVHLQSDECDLVNFLLRNRQKIVWCTRLARAEDQDERKKFEEEMLGLGPDVAAVLEELHATRASDSDSPPSSPFDRDVPSCLSPPIRDYNRLLRANFSISPERASRPSNPSCLSPPIRDYNHLVRENISICPEPESNPEVKNPDDDVVPDRGDDDHVPRKKDHMMEKLEKEQAKRKRPVTSWHKDDLEVHYGCRRRTDDDTNDPDLNDPRVLCSESKLHDGPYQGLPVYRIRKPLFPWSFS